MADDIEITGNPAPYPKTAPSETRSRDIFHSLIDRRFIQGDLRVLDKVPNVDGILEITDENLFPVGKVEVQLKTLDARYYHDPKYSCNPEFIVFCQRSAIPVLLVVVDCVNRKAYWRHMDMLTVHEFYGNLNGNSYTLEVPLFNCIDGKDLDYISHWKQIVLEVRDKLAQFDSIQKENKELLESLKKALRNPVDLPAQNLKELYNFIDHYNYILEREFPSVKKFLYPNYWKIGIGIVKYQYDSVHFLLFPVEYSAAQTLVRTISNEEYKVFNNNMLENNILLIASTESSDSITETPVRYSYRLLSTPILRVAGHLDFFVPNDFLAHEYLTSFIDSYARYLGLAVGAENYSISDLDFRLRYVVPMLEGTRSGYADCVTEYDHWLEDIFYHTIHHDKRIAVALENIKAGVVPKVKVTVYCKKYSLEAIFSYIEWLTKKGVTHVTRVYDSAQRDANMIGVDPLKTWRKEILWKNLVLFLKKFHSIYDLYLETHFPLISKSLQILPSPNTSVAFVFKGLNKSEKPWLEMFVLEPVLNKDGVRKVFSFLDQDQVLPVSYQAFSEKQYGCVIEGQSYTMKEIRVMEVDFMFKDSPTYFLLNDMLSKVLKMFFKDRSSDW